eukprot:gene10327-11399_t
MEKTDLEGILAFGTDGEKTLTGDFRKTFHFSVFLRCFLHIKENISKELTKRGIHGPENNAFIDEIFGKQGGYTQHRGLVDCSTDNDFD